jgi:hypothetical protein
MRVYIVTRNHKIECVFLTLDQAQHHIKSVGGWNIWEIIEKDIEGTLI